MNSADLRKKFLEFFKKNEHTVVPSSSLLPTDPSVLFTTAGMQQFKPYYTGDADAMKDFGSLSTASVQKSMRTSDIEEVGDDTHDTFFEMLGNFSFGGYWKKEAITYAFEFIASVVGLEISYVTVFEGSDVVPKDEESKEIWKSLGVTDIREEGMEDVFWGPTGNNGPCGPTTEIYCKNANGIDVEIWNIVFNEFFCDGSREQLLAGEAKLTPLEKKGIDTGMGLERLAMVAQKTTNIFDTDLFLPILDQVPDADLRLRRIVADHLRSAIFLIADGVLPSNKDQGYILRRLLRRAMTYGRMHHFKKEIVDNIVEATLSIYEGTYKELEEKKEHVLSVIHEEGRKFGETLEKGLKELEKMENIDAKSAFFLYQTFGVPFDILKELSGKEINQKAFEDELKKHQELSKTASAGMFKGGLADHDEKTIRLHTAHHLLLSALQELFGKEVKQRGSNINQERLRIDFSFSRKLTDQEKKHIEDMVNEKIQQGLDVVKREMPKEEAEKIGAEMEFGVKYNNIVSVYFIVPMPEASRIRDGEAIGKDIMDKVFSKEFCGGPHVKNTSELGHFKIVKEEASSQGVRRIKAILE
ncbi:MAG: alanine--tRNA ligase [Candidatus Staskawiczbacteria bacterium]|nr:alanine--tRNA ligase [Candidatus Staskawiczbacteria bacterium]